MYPAIKVTLSEKTGTHWFQNILKKYQQKRQKKFALRLSYSTCTFFYKYKVVRRAE